MIEESIKILTDENISIMNKLNGSFVSSNGELEETISRNEKAIRNLKVKESKENTTDLIVSRRGDYILLNDVKKGDIIILDNAPDYESGRIFKCKVHKDLNRGTVMKVSRNVESELAISAYLDDGNYLKVYTK